MWMLGTTGDLCLGARQFPTERAGLVLFAFLACFCQSADGQANEAKRRITVKDTIEMTEFADRGYFLGGAPESPVAIFSPDGKQFLVRLKKGDVERNAVKYWLLLFRSSEVFRSPCGQVLVEMSSSSNREAIGQVRWLDNRTVAFLGEDVGATPQVYRADIFTKRVVQLTNHPTAVVSYDMSRDGQEIVYEAAPRPRQVLRTQEVLRNGVVITSQTVDELLDDGVERADTRNDRLRFVQRLTNKAQRVPSSDSLTEYLPLEMSPDGRFVVLAVYASEIPDGWKQY